MWIAWTAAALSAEAGASPSGFEVVTEAVSLESGLRIVVQTIDSGVVEIATRFEGGTADSPNAARAAELWFTSPVGDSTGHREMTPDDAYHLVGATAGMRVTPDATVFETRAPAAAIDALLAMEARRLAEPGHWAARRPGGARPSPPDCADPWAAPWTDELLGALYPAAHPYHDLGQAADADPAAAAEWAAARQRPEGTVIALVGDVDLRLVVCRLGTPEECNAVADGELTTIRSRRDVLALPTEADAPEPPAFPMPLPDPPEAVLSRVPAPVHAPMLLAAWALPGQTTRRGDDTPGALLSLARDWAEADLAARIGGDPRVVGGVRCRILPALTHSTLTCQVPLRSAVDAAGVGAIASGRFRWRDIPGALERWRAGAARDVLLAIDDTGRAAALAEFTAITGEPGFEAARLAELEHLTARDAKALRDTALAPGRAALVVLEN